jgi:hypothetical protein
MGLRTFIVSGGGGGSFGGVRLIQPGALASGFVTFSRAQTGATSTAMTSGGGGAWWTEYAADQPRYGGTANRLVLGGQRTTLNTRQRLIGSASWQNTNITATAVTGPDGAAGTANRLDEGTATGNHFATLPAVTITAGVAYSFSAIVQAETCTTCQLYSTATGFNTQTFQNFDLSAGTLGTGGTNSLNPRIVNLGSGWYWISMTALGANLASGRPFVLSMTTGASAVYAETYTGTNRTMLAFWGWTEESAPFPSSAILAATEPAAATRGQDVLTASFSTLFPSGVGTVLGSFVLPFNADASATQTLFEIHDGTANNRIMIRNMTGGATFTATRVTGGSPSSTASLGSMTAGTLFRVGLTFDGTNIAANFNGGSNLTLTGQPAGLTTLRVGNSSAGTAPMFGECGIFDVLPYAIPGAGLPAAVSAIP